MLCAFLKAPLIIVTFSLLFTHNTHGMFSQQKQLEQRVIIAHSPKQSFRPPLLQHLAINYQAPFSQAPIHPNMPMNTLPTTPNIHIPVFVTEQPLQDQSLVKGSNPYVHQQPGSYIPITTINTSSSPDTKQNEGMVDLENGTGLAPAKNANKQNAEFKDKVIKLCGEMMATLAPLKAIGGESARLQTESEETIKKMLAIDLTNEALINESLKLTQKNSDSIEAHLVKINGKLDTTIKSIADLHSLEKGSKIHAIEKKIDGLKGELITQISTTNISIAQIKKQLENPRKEEDLTTKILDHLNALDSSQKKLVAQLNAFDLSHKEMMSNSISESKAWLAKSHRVEQNSVQCLATLNFHLLAQGKFLDTIGNSLRLMEGEQKTTIERLGKINADLLSRDIFISETDKIKKGIEQLNTKLTCLQHDLNTHANKEETIDKQTSEINKSIIDKLNSHEETMKASVINIRKLDNKVKNILESNISSIRAEFKDIKNNFGEMQSKQQQMNKTLENQQKTLETIVASLKDVSHSLKDSQKARTWAGAVMSYPKDVQDQLVETTKDSSDLL